MATAGRPFAQWMITYAVVIWFLLEFLGFLIETYTWDQRIIRTLTTAGVSGFAVVASAFWFFNFKGSSSIRTVLSTLLLSALMLQIYSSARAWNPDLATLPLVITALIVSSVVLLVGLSLWRSDAHQRDVGNLTSDSVAVPKSVAVMPFRSLSIEREDAYFAAGIAEEVLALLVRIPDLQVATLPASHDPDTPPPDPKTIAQELNVSFVLEGSVRRSANQVRVSVQLIRASDGYAIWSKTYRNELTDIFDLQDQIASRVASALKSTLWESVVGEQARKRTTNIEAYREYLLAVQFDRLMHQGGEEDLQQVRVHAERAVALDPDFVPAWIILADVYLNRMGYRMPREEAHELARQALDQALRLEPENPDVILQLAELIRGNHEYSEALLLYRRARKLDPDAPQVDYATLLFTVGDLDLALKEFEHCIDKDPENFSLWYYYASALLSKGDTESALQKYQKSLEIADGGFLADGVRATLAGMTFLYGDQDTAQNILVECLQHNPHRIDFEKGLIAGIRGIMGDKDTAWAVANELESIAAAEHIDPQALFWVYFGIDEADRSRFYYWMEKVIDEDSFPSMYFLLTWPPLDKYRTDDRYQELLKRAGILSINTHPTA